MRGHQGGFSPSLLSRQTAQHHPSSRALKLSLLFYLDFWISTRPPLSLDRRCGVGDRSFFFPGAARATGSTKASAHVLPPLLEPFSGRVHRGIVWAKAKEKDR